MRDRSEVLRSKAVGRHGGGRREEHDGLVVVEHERMRQLAVHHLASNERRDQTLAQASLVHHLKLAVEPVVDVGRRAAIGETHARLAELVEEGVGQGIERVQTRRGDVAEELRDKIDGRGRGAVSEHARPCVRLNGGEAEARVVGVHGVDFLARGRAEDLDDLDQLLQTAIAREQRGAEQELCHDASKGPDVDGSGVLGGLEHELGRAVVARANVRHVRLAAHKLLRATKVAELHLMGPSVEQEVLRFDVAVTHVGGVEVSQGAADLIHVALGV